MHALPHAHLHDHNGVHKLVDVRRAGKDDGASVIYGQDFMAATDGYFAKVQVHHPKPKGTHGFAHADVLQEIHEHTHNADALPDDGVAKLRNDQV